MTNNKQKNMFTLSKLSKRLFKYYFIFKINFLHFSRLIEEKRQTFISNNLLKNIIFFL